MKQKAYAAAGVDIDLGNRVKAGLPRLLASTHRREVLGKVGGFGGLFALDTRKYKQPVLVSSVDGVGTKLKIAFEMDRHDTIGQDLVNHCVNDIAVLGAEPLFFLDYLGTGKLEPHVFADILGNAIRRTWDIRFCQGRAPPLQLALFAGVLDALLHFAHGVEVFVQLALV